MVLDLDGTPNNCDAEVLNPTAIQLSAFPADLNSDNGNNCVKPMVDAVNSLRGQVVLIPICDGDCVTAGGSQASYHIIKVAAFYLDYMSEQNGGVNAACVGNGVTIVPITGNGSSSCRSAGSSATSRPARSGQDRSPAPRQLGFSLSIATSSVAKSSSAVLAPPPGTEAAIHLDRGLGVSSADPGVVRELDEREARADATSTGARSPSGPPPDRPRRGTARAEG